MEGLHLGPEFDHSPHPHLTKKTPSCLSVNPQPNQPWQVVGREDVTALVRRTSITPRAALPAQGAMKQMQVCLL